MKLFIGNIPGDALLVDIYEFLGGLELRADFHAHQGYDASEKRYHYVVAELSEPADIDRLIEQYNGVPFHGNSLVVRKYRERSPYPYLHYEGEEKRINIH